VAEVEHIIQDQREQVLLVDLVEQQFQELVEPQHLRLVMEP
jgi:pheromone shutdown protein TraB